MSRECFSLFVIGYGFLILCVSGDFYISMIYILSEGRGDLQK